MKYKITVETGNLRGAGTNASVSIKLKGTIQFDLSSLSLFVALKIACINPLSKLKAKKSYYLTVIYQAQGKQYVLLTRECQ